MNTTKTLRYQPVATLSGPRDAVISLAFSAKARFLSASGYNGVHVWDLSSSTSISTPLPHMLFAPQKRKYVITASVWVYFQKNSRHILLLGSMRGDVLLWDWQEDKKSFNLLYRVHPINDTQDEVLSMDVHEQDITSGRIGRIVVATANRSVSVWTLSSTGEFAKVFTTTLDQNIIPKTVRMCKQTRDIFVFPLYSGEILRLDYKTGAITARKSQDPGRMGSVALNNDSNKFVAYTGKNFQLYSLINLKILRTFQSETPVVFFPKHVVFGELEDIVVGGTDRACALVYNTNSESAIETLSYPGGSLVQPVTTISIPGRHLIAIAGSTADQPAPVVLFEKIIPAQPKADTAKSTVISSSEPGPIYIGFYLPRKFFKWMRIFLTLVFVLVAIYLLSSKYLAQVLSDFPGLRLNAQVDSPRSDLRRETEAAVEVGVGDITHELDNSCGAQQSPDIILEKGFVLVAI